MKRIYNELVAILQQLYQMVQLLKEIKMLLIKMVNEDKVVKFKSSFLDAVVVSSEAYLYEIESWKDSDVYPKMCLFHWDNKDSSYSIGSKIRVLARRIKGGTIDPEWYYELIDIPEMFGNTRLFIKAKDLEIE